MTYDDIIMITCFFIILSELTQIVTDVISDPTLPRTADHPCMLIK
jgi:hypothetical protein